MGYHPRPFAPRFWRSVNKAGPFPTAKGVKGRCWVWTRPPRPDGYGQIWHVDAQRALVAHKAAMLYIYNVEVPDDLTIDHLCRNRLCVRRSHLEVVPRGVNVLRGSGHAVINKAKTHCIRGHQEWYVRPDGRRQCRACARELDRKRRRVTLLPSRN